MDSMLRIRGGELPAPTSAPVAPGRSYPFQVVTVVCYMLSISLGAIGLWMRRR